MTIPPGPAGFAILQPSLSGHRRKAVLELLGFAAADLLVLLLCVFNRQVLASTFDYWPLKLLAGVLLITLAIYLLFSKNNPNDWIGKSFWWTLLNPAVWFSNIALVGLGASMPTNYFVFYILGILLGYISWYALVISLASRIPPNFRQYIERAAIYCILVAGLILGIHSLRF